MMQPGNHDTKQTIQQAKCGLVYLSHDIHALEDVMHCGCWVLYAHCSHDTCLQIKPEADKIGVGATEHGATKACAGASSCLEALLSSYKMNDRMVSRR